MLEDDGAVVKVDELKEGVRYRYTQTHTHTLDVCPITTNELFCHTVINYLILTY